MSPSCAEFLRQPRITRQTLRLGSLLPLPEFLSRFWHVFCNPQASLWHGSQYLPNHTGVHFKTSTSDWAPRGGCGFVPSQPPQEEEEERKEEEEEDDVKEMHAEKARNTLSHVALQVGRSHFTVLCQVLLRAHGPLLVPVGSHGLKWHQASDFQSQQQNAANICQVSWGLPVLTLVWLLILLNGCEDHLDTRAPNSSCPADLLQDSNDLSIKPEPRKSIGQALRIAHCMNAARVHVICRCNVNGQSAAPAIPVLKRTEGLQ